MDKRDYTAVGRSELLARIAELEAAQQKVTITPTPVELTDSEIRELAKRELAASSSQRSAARKAGISREVLLALAAGAPVRPATFALIRERLARLESDHG